MLPTTLYVDKINRGIQQSSTVIHRGASTGGRSCWSPCTNPNPTLAANANKICIPLYSTKCRGFQQGSFHGSQIPLEPMYLLLNTAVSTTWGFPDCHTGCACDCFDARDPACACAIAPGFDSIFPAEFVVDSVSVSSHQASFRWYDYCTFSGSLLFCWFLLKCLGLFFVVVSC